MNLESEPFEFVDSVPPNGRAIEIFQPPSEVANYAILGVPEKFPCEALPPLLRKIAENMASVYQTPVCLPALCALGVLSGAVGKSAIVNGAYKDKITRLNLYIVPCAERGSGKDIIGETLCGPLSRRSQLLAQEHGKVVSGQRAEVGLLKRKIQELQTKGAKNKDGRSGEIVEQLNEAQQRLDQLEKEIGRNVALLTNDSTGEALGRDLSDNAETLCNYSAEAGGALKVALGKYSKNDDGDFELYLSGYSGGQVRISRMTRKVELQNPCLSLLWLVQPCVAHVLMGTAEAFNRGLTARMMIFDSGAQREHDDRQNLAFAFHDEWEQFTYRILDRRFSASPPLEIICTPEAREVFAKFHDESVDLERGPFADLMGELSRWRENAIKVAGLFALAEDAKEVSAELAARAVRVVRWAGFNYLFMLQKGRKERMHSELATLTGILTAKGGELNIGKLAEKHGIKRDRLNAIVAAFPEQVEIQRRSQVGAGRPAEVAKLISKSS